MDMLCPICQRLLKRDSCNEFIDYHCYPSVDSHHYVARMKEDTLVTMKVRLSPQDTKLFFKVDFVKGHSEVWTKPGDRSSRMIINHTFMPDFTDLAKLEEKIRTYILFS